MSKQLIPHVGWQLRLHLVEQRHHVILQGSFSSALVIDEARLTMIHHDVPRLEITVHEGFVKGLANEIGKGVAFGFESGFVKDDLGMRLHEIILEIVEVVHHRRLVETGHGIHL